MEAALIPRVEVHFPVVDLRRTDLHGVVSSGGGEAITAVGVVKRRNGTAKGFVGNARQVRPRRG